MKKTALKTLVVVDVQAAFPVPPRLVRRIRAYARRFDRRVFTQYVNPPGSLVRRKLDQRCCAPGSPGTRLLIEPRKGDVVLVKTGYGLDARAVAKLKRLGLRRATVCGLDTDCCVLGVMFSLWDAHVVCRVKEDLCWSSGGLHREALKILRRQFPARL